MQSRAGGAEQGLFEEDMVMCWFVQLLLALHHLHGRRVLHRDLKPDNVLLSGNLRVARLADFGVSKQLEQGVGLAVTCLGESCLLSACVPHGSIHDWIPVLTRCRHEPKSMAAFKTACELHMMSTYQLGD
jgi:serine/threonine protein kinase